MMVADGREKFAKTALKARIFFRATQERQVSALRIDSLQKQTASLDALLAAERRQRADVELRLQHLNQEFEGYKVLVSGEKSSNFD